VQVSEEKPDPLRLVLHHMEEQLDDRVDKLNDAGPSSGESTADLIQLEETLSSAQDKAKKLVTLRLKLDEEASHDGDEASAPSTDRVAPDHPASGDTAA
jgi:hypothetical protein